MSNDSCWCIVFTRMNWVSISNSSYRNMRFYSEISIRAGKLTVKTISYPFLGTFLKIRDLSPFYLNLIFIFKTIIFVKCILIMDSSLLPLPTSSHLPNFSTPHFYSFFLEKTNKQLKETNK